MANQGEGVSETIDQLVKLQSVAKEHFLLHEEKDRITKALEKEKDNLQRLEEDYRLLGQQIKDLSHDMGEVQKQIQEALEAIKKLKAKEPYVKTQKEYIALDTEQSIQRDKIEGFEKENQAKTKELGEIKTRHDEKKQEVKDQKDRFSEEQLEVDSNMEDIDKKLQDIERIRSEVLPNIDPLSLTRFERIVKNKNGIGIVPVTGGICEGCNIAVTPQVISEIRSYKEIIYCINCARILYLPKRTSIFD
ncbi:MAG: hypothetical protein IEMM0008_0130 [bacterium]|nr:MAG: hypothetical protein IEMM0008_0130 [bacterium]